MDWSYDAWPSGEPYDWGNASRGHTRFDAMDFHVDLGCGKLKKGRIGIDRYPAPGVNVVMDLNALEVYGVARQPGEDAVAATVVGTGLPFADSSIKSVISHHCLEHISNGFIPLVDDVYRVLEPGGMFYAITPLFPSRSAVEDPDHRRYFMCNADSCTWDAFCGDPQNCWLESFSVPYTSARFSLVYRDYTPPVPLEEQWGTSDAREMRVAMVAMK